MQIGDLVHWKASEADPYQLWLVSDIYASSHTALLISETRTKRIVGLDDVDEMIVVHRPLHNWWQVTLPVKRGRIHALRVGPTSLLWLHDWAKIGEFQMGGMIYINPDAQLKYGQKITVTRDKGVPIIVPVPRFLASIAQKEKATALAKAAEEKPVRGEGIYGLLQDDDD